MATLSDDEIRERLPEGWDLSSGEVREIHKAYRFDAFLTGIGFVDRVAEAAEAADHHPDIDIRWTTVRLALSTHAEGGVTEKDLALATEADRLAAGAG
jgi:4a-hydroxytetrahydrobiopterin dehydratase